MWHASVSLQHPKRGPIDDEATVERAAVEALWGVGGANEWWWWSPNYIGHLRVPVTKLEAVEVPPGLVTTDAGEAGLLRERTV